MVTVTHTSDNFEDQNGNEWVVGPGGSITVQQGGCILESVQDGIVAHAGGGQSGATPAPGDHQPRDDGRHGPPTAWRCPRRSPASR